MLREWGVLKVGYAERVMCAKSEGCAKSGVC